MRVFIFCLMLSTAVAMSLYKEYEGMADDDPHKGCGFSLMKASMWICERFLGDEVPADIFEKRFYEVSQAKKESLKLERQGKLQGIIHKCCTEPCGVDEILQYCKIMD